jgi:hypothetical protein
MKRTLCLAAALLLTAGAVMAQTTANESSRQNGNSTPSHEGPTGSSDTQNSSVLNPSERGRAIDYWTTERMREATPMALPEVDPDAVRRTAR